jgi:hypothetical protein
MIKHITGNNLGTHDTGHEHPKENNDYLNQPIYAIAQTLKPVAELFHTLTLKKHR